MKRLFILISILFLSFSAVNAFGAVSTFDSGIEDWTLVSITDFDNPVASVSAGPALYDEDGYIYAIDSPDMPTGILAFSAPAKFLGNHADLLDDSFSFDIMATFPYYTKVLFLNGTNYLASPFISVPLGEWQNVSLTIDESWYYNSLGNASVTEINSVLDNLTAIYIVGDTMFTRGETTYLDNVTMSHTPIPGSVLLLGTGLISLFAFKRRKN